MARIDPNRIGPDYENVRIIVSYSVASLGYDIRGEWVMNGQFHTSTARVSSEAFKDFNPPPGIISQVIQLWMVQDGMTFNDALRRLVGNLVGNSDGYSEEVERAFDKLREEVRVDLYG